MIHRVPPSKCRKGLGWKPAASRLLGSFRGLLSSSRSRCTERIGHVGIVVLTRKACCFCPSDRRLPPGRGFRISALAVPRLRLSVCCRIRDVHQEKTACTTALQMTACQQMPNSHKPHVMQTEKMERAPLPLFSWIRPVHIHILHACFFQPMCAHESGPATAVDLVPHRKHEEAEARNTCYRPACRARHQTMASDHTRKLSALTPG